MYTVIDTYKTCGQKIFRVHRKRGPRDGWHGLTLKILKFISQHKIVSSKEIAQHFDITDRAVRYHLKKLREMGFIERIGNPPFCYYKLRSNGIAKISIHYQQMNNQLTSQCDIRVTSVTSEPYKGLISCDIQGQKLRSDIYKELREVDPLTYKGRQLHSKTLILLYIIRKYYPIHIQELNKIFKQAGVPLRTLRYHLKKLIDMGLVLRLGGKHCPHAVLIPSHGIKIIHEHKYTKYHRYHTT